MKTAIADIASEDYENDRALGDFSLLYTGANPLPEDFWQRHGKDLKSWTDKGRTFYEMTVAEDEDWHPNQFLYLPGDEQTELRVTKVDGERATLQVVDDYRNSSHSDRKEHTSELQSLMSTSYAVFCLKKNTPLNDIPPLASS